MTGLGEWDVEVVRVDGNAITAVRLRRPDSGAGPPPHASPPNSTPQSSSRVEDLHTTVRMKHPRNIRSI